ncbi:hypothetical protein V6N13_009233 [Hibiscus sabdariffa]
MLSVPCRWIVGLLTRLCFLSEPLLKTLEGNLCEGFLWCELLQFVPPPIADSLSEELSSAREKTSKPITVLMVGVRILFSLDPVGIVVLFAVVPSEGVL